MPCGCTCAGAGGVDVFRYRRELKVEKPGTFCVGVARMLEGEALDQELGSGEKSWACRFDAEAASAGDRIGCVFAQVSCVSRHPCPLKRCDIQSSAWYLML
jgi:hypothetical protein